MKSGVARRKSLDGKSASCVPESPVVKCNHDFQHGSIEITRVFDKPRVFEGKRHFGRLSGKVLKKNRKPAIFANLACASNNKVNSAMTDAMVKERVHFAEVSISILSGMSPNV